MSYEDIRTALKRGFSLDTLHQVTRLGHALLDSETPLRHPAAAYVIAATAQKVASYWDEQGVREDVAAVIEAHIRPKLEAIVDVAEGDAEALVRSFDELARAYTDAVPFLKSIGT